jgi:hypothetical protein
MGQYCCAGGSPNELIYPTQQPFSFSSSRETRNFFVAIAMKWYRSSSHSIGTPFLFFSAPGPGPGPGELNYYGDMSQSHHTVLSFSYQQDTDVPAWLDILQLQEQLSLPLPFLPRLPAECLVLFAARSRAAPRTSRRARVPFFSSGGRASGMVTARVGLLYYPTNLSSRTPTGPMLVFETLRTAAWPGDLYSFPKRHRRRPSDARPTRLLTFNRQFERKRRGPPRCLNGLGRLCQTAS